MELRALENELSHANKDLEEVATENKNLKKQLEKS